MPSLKDVHCFIELPDGKSQLREFGTKYGDGCVETFVTVPNRVQPFAIRLSSSKFIAPGLAMYVFIDGVYQCNRNRQNLKLRKSPDKKSLVDFVVRQKEERQGDGTMIARDWSFEKLDIVSANDAPDVCSPKLLDNIGCIEVIVLRCAGTRNAKSKPSRMNLDGAGDAPDRLFGSNGGFDGPQSDDFGWQFLQSGWNSRTPTNPYGGPPAPLASPSHGVSAIHSSPRIAAQSSLRGTWHNSRDLSTGYRYGSGPITHRPRTASVHAPPSGVTGANAPFDMNDLDKALANAVQKGIENYHEKMSTVQSQTAPAAAFDQPSSNLPGSWPSPYGEMESALSSPTQTAAPNSVPPPPSSAFGLQLPPANTHINWKQHLPTRPSNGWVNGKGWESGEEDSKTDTWDTEDTWGAKQEGNGQRPSERESESRRKSNRWGTSAILSPSPTAQTNRTGDWTRSSDFHTARSRPHEPVWVSKVDGDGWSHIDASSDMNSSWTSRAASVHPSESISVTTPSQIINNPLANLLSRSLHSVKNDEKRARSEVTSSWANWSVSTPKAKKQRVADDAVSIVPAPLSTVVPVDQVPSPFGTLEVPQDGSIDKKSRSTSGRYKPKVEPIHWGAVKKQNSKPSSAEKSPLRKEIVTLNEGRHPSGTWSNPSRKSSDDESWHTPEDKGNPSGWSSGSKPSEEQDKDNDKDKWVPEKPAKPKPNTARDSTWQASLNGWTAGQKAKSVVDAVNPWSPPPDKAKPKDSPQPEPKQHKDSPSKPHREFPPPTPPAQKLLPAPELENGLLAAEPRLKVREKDAARKGVEHQVRAGKGMSYGHAVGRPEYLDSLDKPYATFRFKYRSHAALQRLLGPGTIPSSASDLVTKPNDPLKLVQPADDTVKIPKADVKKQLEKLPTKALVDGLLELQGKLEREKRGKEGGRANGKRDGGVREEEKARSRTESWVKEVSLGGGGSDGWSVEKGEEGKNEGWGAGGDW